MQHNSLTRRLSLRALQLSPLRRRFLLIAADVLLIPLALWLSFWLRLADSWSPQLQDSLWMLPLAWLIALPLYGFTGQYKGLTRYAGSTALYRLAWRNGLLVLLLAMAGVMLQLPLPPRSSWLLLWLLLTGLTGTVRFALRDALLKLQDGIGQRRVRVAIYGAGAAGAQLAASLRLAGGHSITAFLDDAPQLWRRSINGIAIHPPSLLKQVRSDVDQVLLAIPSLSRRRRREIVAELQTLDIPVLQVPSVEEITSGMARIDALRPIAIEELLGRDSVPPDPQLLGPGIEGAVVCVTGAGGSIGSELCRQIMLLGPQLLILLEQSEPSLYAIEQELRAAAPASTSFCVVLGNAADKNLLEQLFSAWGVQVVFHAAAYKHVPLVELNPLAGQG
ncbi:polysaccharide biosynthesis protein [Synechococcus sp. JJ3a-Johnson]|uniref:polysaccharide biosynthesis protein n=1 Tax=Synechococcus sp. JJ3a-Johnson TaxID=2823738 RepID=UPI0020CDDA31|nr:polysaccharide biosynthesis protein [Synechococcus sp. JJ3a-Johnson]MCP9830101.1 polysaccharide biosynthesis protein [Synechococcus sp. JJ3a-Johnson]